MHCIITILDQMCFEKFSAFMDRLQQIATTLSIDGPVPDNSEIHLYYTPVECVDSLAESIDKFLMKENILAEVNFMEEEYDGTAGSDRTSELCGA